MQRANALVASLLLVAVPGAPSSVLALATTCKCAHLGALGSAVSPARGTVKTCMSIASAMDPHLAKTRQTDKTGFTSLFSWLRFGASSYLICLSTLNIKRLHVVVYMSISCSDFLLWPQQGAYEAYETARQNLRAPLRDKSR